MSCSYIPFAEVLLLSEACCSLRAALKSCQECSTAAAPAIWDVLHFSDFSELVQKPAVFRLYWKSSDRHAVGFGLSMTIRIAIGSRQIYKYKFQLSLNGQENSDAYLAYAWHHKDLLILEEWPSHRSNAKLSSAERGTSSPLMPAQLHRLPAPHAPDFSFGRCDYVVYIPKNPREESQRIRK